MDVRGSGSTEIRSYQGASCSSRDSLCGGGHERGLNGRRSYVVGDGRQS